MNTLKGGPVSTRTSGRPHDGREKPERGNEEGAVPRAQCRKVCVQEKNIPIKSCHMESMIAVSVQNKKR